MSRNRELDRDHPLLVNPPHPKREPTEYQKARRELRKSHIRQLVLKSEYVHGVTCLELARAWKVSQNYVQRIASEAKSCLALAFDKSEATQRMLVRTEQIQQEAMARGRYAAALRAMDVQMRLLDVGRPELGAVFGRIEHTVNQTNTVNQTVVVSEGEDGRVLRVPALKSLLRGIGADEAKTVEPAVIGEEPE